MTKLWPPLVVLGLLVFVTGADDASKERPKSCAQCHSPGGVAAKVQIKENPMTQPATPEQQKMQNVHGFLSAKCFNDCWTLIEKPNRTPEETENMLLLADASLWHWKQRSDVTPQNLSVGYWQVSRVHALAGQYEMAKLFGEKCRKISEDHKVPPFYIGYAYEALARAEILHQDTAKAKEYLDKAKKLLEEVKEADDKKLLQDDLAALEKALAK